MNFERILIIICIINFLLVGGITVVDHQSLASTIGLSLNTGLAHSEMVAMYGGFQIALAIFFMLSYSRVTWHEPALYVAALTMGGIAVGRIVAALKVGLPEAHGLMVFVIEIIMTIVIALCLRHMKRRSTQPTK